MAYVGRGLGDYRQTANYVYVGEGHGQFGVAPMPNPGMSRRFCSGTFIGGAILLVGLSLLICFRLVGRIQTQDAPAAGFVGAATPRMLPQPPLPTLSVTPQPFDCETGTPTAWPLQKANWCCDAYGTGCQTASPASLPSLFPAQPAGLQKISTPAEQPKVSSKQEKEQLGEEEDEAGGFDCTVGLAPDWSFRKSIWCCIHEHEGCATTMSPTMAPSSREATALRGVQPRAPPSPASDTMPHNCTAGLASWEQAWSSAKKEWCCEHETRGCSTTAAPEREMLAITRAEEAEARATI